MNKVEIGIRAQTSSSGTDLTPVALATAPISLYKGSRQKRIWVGCGRNISELDQRNIFTDKITQLCIVRCSSEIVLQQDIL